MTENGERAPARTVAALPGERAAPARVKVWTGLGSVLLTGAALSLLPHTSQAGVLGKLAKSGASTPSLIQLAAGEGGEGGEGGEAAREIDPGTDDVAYLTQLGLMRGHLEVGMDLYRQGEHEAALPQMENAIEEIYEPLEPALDKRGVAAFEEQLESLEQVVEQGAPLERVEAAYEEAQNGIETAEATVPEAERRDLANRFAVMVNLVRAGAAEYDEALGEDGRVVKPVEYQEALGFVRAAQAMLDQTPAAERARAADAIARAKAQFDAVAGLWPSLVPPATVEGDPSKLFGAAAYIEIAGLHVK
jgi:hypothetical protein